MAKQEIIITKQFTNRDEVVEKMHELGFFGGYAALRDEFNEGLQNPNGHTEHWASNGVNEVKIMTNPWNPEEYQLLNSRSVNNETINAIFAVAH